MKFITLTSAYARNVRIYAQSFIYIFDMMEAHQTHYHHHIHIEVYSRTKPLLIPFLGDGQKIRIFL